MIRKIVILIISILFLCGCNSKEKTIYEYYVTVDDVDIKVDALFNYLKVSLYEYNDIIFSSNSDNIIYSYNDMEIETYIDNNVEKVKGFWFTSNKYNTNEGVRIGDNVSKMFDVYGYDYNFYNDIYEYKLNNSSLSFLTGNGIIEGIEYRLV